MASISRFRIRNFIFIVSSRKAAIVIFCIKINYDTYLLQTSYIHLIKEFVNISDMCVLLSPGMMDSLVKFEVEVQ